MSQPNQITYSSKYTKLSKRVHTTVRWLDNVYKLGAIYSEVFVSSSKFHEHFHKGDVRIIKLEIKKLSELTDEFIREDADCDKETFFKMMQNWYKYKPDWKDWDSEIQVLTLERIGQ